MMCDLCSEDKSIKQRAVETARLYAEQFDALAIAYRHMADGKLNPHSEEAKKVGVVARSVVRELISEWV